MITDEMVEKALAEWYNDPNWHTSTLPITAEQNKKFVVNARKEMRATLEAALSASPLARVVEAARGMLGLGGWVPMTLEREHLRAALAALDGKEKG